MGSIIVHTLSKAFTKVITFSGVLAQWSLPVDFHFNADPSSFEVDNPYQNRVLRRYRIVSSKIEVQMECSLHCSYKFVCFDKRFYNESAMLTCPIHDSKRNRNVHFMAAKETKNNGIIKK